MANLPEKNITTVDKVTSIPGNANLYINANGEFRQATVDDVLKASPVIADSIANQYKNAEGSPILLTDSAKGVAIDFNAKGRSTQTQYSGKNKLNCSGLSATTLNGITFTPVYDDNGSLLYVNVNGTATAKVDFALNDLGYTTWADLGFEYDTQYTLSGCPSNGSWLSYYLYLDSTTINGSNIIKRDYGSGLTFSVSSEESEFKLKFFIRIESGTVCNNLKFYPMLRLASVTDSTYEPYVGGTASPNPSYPQAIKSVGDMGYFDGELLNGVYNTSNGIYGSNANYLCNKNPIPCNASDEVTFTHHTDTQYNLMILFYDVDMNYLSYKNTTTSDTLTATAPTNASYCNFNIGYGSALSVANASPITVTINDKYALIVDSNNDRKYIPISAPLRGLGGVTDVSSLSEREVERKFAEVVFDGSENWNLSNGSFYILSNTLDYPQKPGGNALCSHFTNVTSGGNWGIIIPTSKFTTVAEFKAWLSNNPITVQYELAEPTTESIEPIEIVTYDNVTQISVSDDADMEVEYPTSKVAGIASIGWSKGRRAEYDLEQLKAQMLALQTTIVSTV